VPLPEILKSSQPGPLLLGKSPSQDLDSFNGILEAALVLEVSEQLLVTQRFAGLNSE